jgi:predicted chitinase
MAEKKSIFSMFPNYISPLGDWQTVEKKEENETQKKIKPKLSLKFLFGKEDFINYSITLAIESKNLKDKNGFLQLIDKDTNNIISTVELDIVNDGFSKQFLFFKSNFSIFTNKNFIVKLFCGGIITETEPFNLIKKSKPLTCSCNRDFTTDEVQEIVEGIRDNIFYTDNGKKYPISNLRKELFNRNSETYKDYNKEIVPLNERTYQKVTDSLNKSFKTFNINTCIKKIHFLSHMTIETAYFTATIELKDEKIDKYDPYRGRGFIQLTHEGNEDSRTKNATGYLGFKKYSSKDVLKTPSLISTSIELSAESAGWFWNNGVRKEDGSTINLNLLCKDTEDAFKEITRLIKGGTKELKERQEAYNILKIVFNYDKCKTKK